MALAAGKAGRWKRSICLRASLNEQQSETCLRRDAECQPQAVIGGDCLMFLRSFKAAHVDHCIKYKEISKRDPQALRHDAGQHASG